VIFSRQFATMIGAGIPIARSLAILKTQTSNKTLASALETIAHDVESGSTLSDSISKYPKIFSPIYTSMVHAGEVGGILDDVLNRLADQMEKDSELVSKVRGAMVYPGLIFVVMIAALIFIMTVVVPQLEVVFDAVDTELPWNTQLLLNLSATMRSQGILIGIVAVAAVFFFCASLKRTKNFAVACTAYISRFLSSVWLFAR
jgi:type IV pilus assembly protein PilC